MGRQYNQDYFKVAGSRIGDRDRAGSSKAQLAHEQADLRQAAPLPLRRPAPSTSRRAPAEAPRPTQTPLPMPARPPPAAIRTVSGGKPRHGQKRRSTRKRHEADVIAELQTHPDESPQTAGYLVRHERPSAEVIDVREGARRLAGRQSSGMAHALPDEGLIGLTREFLAEARTLLAREVAGALRTATEILVSPWEAFEILRRRET